MLKMDNVEHMLARPLSLKEASRLDALEDRVWQQVHSRMARRDRGRLHLAMIAMALVVGVVNGGIAVRHFQPTDTEMQAFSLSSGLIPLDQTGHG